MNSAPIFERVYARIRSRILTGWWRPSARIDLAGLADDLSASITPVRDALYRLVGERLIVLGVSEGFALPGLTEPDLRDRYRWSQMLTLLALKSATESSKGLLVPLLEHADLETRPARLFRDLAKQTEDIEMIDAMDAISDRLAYARSIELKLGIVTLDEMTALLQAIDNGTPAVRRAAVIRYHRRRLLECGRIVECVHRAPSYG